MNNKGWAEVQPLFTGRLGPSKAGSFKSRQPAGLTERPLDEAPTAAGWWVVKYPTAQKPFMHYFERRDLQEMEGLQEDGLAFYGWTPITPPR